MKKSIIAVLLCVLCVILLLCSCGNKVDPSSILGEWKLTAIYVDDELMNISGLDTTFVFKEGGRGERYSGIDLTSSFEYSIQKDTLNISDRENNFSVSTKIKIKGDELKFITTYNDGYVETDVYKKVK